MARSTTSSPSLYAPGGRCGPRTGATSAAGRAGAKITNTIHISERPAEATDRAVPGHWEGDLMLGKGMSGIAILVERTSRFVMLIELPDGIRSEPVVAALATAENTIGLLRQYFPKRSDIRPYHQADLDKVAAQLNGRPRKTLEFMTPSQKFAEAVASTR